MVAHTQAVEEGKGQGGEDLCTAVTIVKEMEVKKLENKFYESRPQQNNCRREQRKKRNAEIHLTPKVTRQRRRWNFANVWKQQNI